MLTDFYVFKVVLPDVIINFYSAMGTNYKSPQPQPKLRFNPLRQGQKVVQMPGDLQS